MLKMSRADEAQNSEILTKTILQKSVKLMMKLRMCDDT